MLYSDFVARFHEVLLHQAHVKLAAHDLFLFYFMTPALLKNMRNIFFCVSVRRIFFCSPLIKNFYLDYLAHFIVLISSVDYIIVPKRCTKINSLNRNKRINLLSLLYILYQNHGHFDFVKTCSNIGYLYRCGINTSTAAALDKRLSRRQRIFIDFV